MTRASLSDTLTALALGALPEHDHLIVEEAEISLPLLVPFAYILLRSSDVGLDRAIALVFRGRVWGLLANTMTLLVLVSVLAVTIGTVSAFLLERFRIFGRSFFAVTVTLPLCIPAFVSGFSWISLSFRFSGLGGAVMVMTMVAGIPSFAA